MVGRVQQMSGELQCNDFDGIVYINILMPGVAYIITIDGVYHLYAVSAEIESILEVIELRSDCIHVVSKHFDRKEKFLDIIKLEGRNKSDFL